MSPQVHINEHGLSSDEALQRLLIESRAIIRECAQSRVHHHRNLHEHTTAPTYFFCPLALWFIRIVVIFLLIGSVDIDNSISYSLCAIYVLLFVYTFLVEIWQEKVCKNRESSVFRRFMRVLDDIEKKLSSITYSSPSNLATSESLTDEAAINQLCLRDGQLVSVPQILLVPNDLILIRPGWSTPSECTTLTDRVKLAKGLKYAPSDVLVDDSTHFVEPLKPIWARVTCAPIRDHFAQHFQELQRDETKLLFDRNLHQCVHSIFERMLVPIVTFVAVTVTVVRFAYSDHESLYGTRFVFAAAALIILPMLNIHLPLIVASLLAANQSHILSHLTFSGTCDEPLLPVLAALTGASFVDKKGLLSSTQPSIEKLIFADKTERLETLDMSSDLDPACNQWRLEFDDNNSWKQHLASILPIAYNIHEKRCEKTAEFHQILADHLTIVASDIPLAIASSQRRCMCQLPLLIGYEGQAAASSKQVMVAAYRRHVPDSVPSMALARHRTPIESMVLQMARDGFVCQGTANIVVDMCGHVWNGEHVIPLSARLASAFIDVYQRHSMTGHCVSLAFRRSHAVSLPANDVFIEFPAGSRKRLVGDRVPSAVSQLSLSEPSQLDSAEQLLDELASGGNVLCGLVALQYEAIPSAVQLVEGLDAICVRPVYFSKENELRSRVFAEKLGLEAGWNCHISLAEDEPPGVTERRFASRVPSRPKLAGRRALSECDVSATTQPRLKTSTSGSVQLGTIPNHARLPQGVANVRPHLESVDNVPLLVGLFTDSTSHAVEQMLEILQENGEVVAVVGSSRNVNNSRLFSKANLSISVDAIDDATCRIQAQPKSTADEIGAALISSFADLHLSHPQLAHLPSAITLARERASSLRASLSFLAAGSTTISLTLLVAAMATLPPIATHSQVLLTTLVHLPLLCIGTHFVSHSPSLIRIAGKNEATSVAASGAIREFVELFATQFAPTVVYLNALFFGMLAANANLICAFSDISCIFNTDEANGDEERRMSLSTSTIRHIMGFQMTVCLCVLSSPFVYELSPAWKLPPFRCKLWIFSCVIAISTQLTFGLMNVRVSDYFLPIPTVLLICWCSIVVVVNEIIKVRRIRRFVREQRRTKFDFDTKLGMNSPY